MNADILVEFLVSVLRDLKLIKGLTVNADILVEFLVSVLRELN